MSEKENVNAAPANTDPQTAAAADPLLPFYKLAESLMAGPRKELSQAISIVYGALTVLLEQGVLQAVQVEQLIGRFTIAYMAL